MKNILYIPLDERPCNYRFPAMMAEMQKKRLALKNIPFNLLGHKKQVADIRGVQQWLKEAARDIDAAVISIEMLVYGGLLPSRLHTMTADAAQSSLNILTEIKKENPHLKIYASNLIMRTPKYSSSDEEPDYYEEYGREIFLKAYLEDKKSRMGKLSDEEQASYLKVRDVVPEIHLADYSERRATNRQITAKVLELVAAGIIDYLVIPQDDSAPFGYTAQDQIEVKTLLERFDLADRVAIYPGADEVGATLLVKAYCEVFNFSPEIYPVFPSVNSQTLIPLYEDRPIGESMKSHIYAAGGTLALTPETATIILGYNTAGDMMQESWDQKDKRDITYTTHRNLQVFVEQLKVLHQKGKAICIADSAYANGGDLELIKLLDKNALLEILLSYKGWNTNCNTLGTTLAAAIFAYGTTNREYIDYNIIYHILDDVCYQAIVRADVNENVLHQYNANYFNIKEQEAAILVIIEEKIMQVYSELVKNSFNQLKIEALKSYSPWNRMFEIGLNPVIKKEE